mgnify:CR=1 FL=1
MMVNIKINNVITFIKDITYDDYWGLSKEVFDDLKVDIKGLKSKYSTLLTTDTPENRKYFLHQGSKPFVYRSWKYKYDCHYNTF